MEKKAKIIQEILKKEQLEALLYFSPENRF
jgi:hypothetical protein